MASASPGHVELQRTLESITVGDRHRTDLGDLDALTASIQEHGLLQPITLTPDGVLVCGRRRLEALRRLGHRTTNVWVRTGLTDRLGQLLAEQDDNALHKPLSFIEAESLYRELKVVMAEDAARRQHATRFGSVQAAGGSFAGVSGAVDSTAPRSAGEARVQAARLVTGRGSQTLLEQIGRLKDIANDDTRPAHIRAQAVGELERIGAGQKVNGAHVRMNTALALDELDQIAGDTVQPPHVRDEASRAAADLRGTDDGARAADLERQATEALARVKAEKHAGRPRRPPAPRGRALTLVMLPPRAFLALWDDLAGWTEKYHPDQIADELTDEQWARVEATAAETDTFIQQIRARRDGHPVAASR